LQAKDSLEEDSMMRQLRRI